MPKRPHIPGLKVSLPRTVVSVLALLFTIATLGQATTVPAARQARNVAVITIKGTIESKSLGSASPTLVSLDRRLKLAQRAGADAVVIELDTPGGSLEASMGIADAIKASPIKNTVAWIRPSAYSGGAIIAFACREMICSDPATMGDAIIIAMDPLTMRPIPLRESERQKMLVPLLSNLVDSARRNGHDEFLAQGIATTGVELWMVRHKTSGDLLFINRAEYKLLFEQDPPVATPSIVAAPPMPDPVAEPRQAPQPNRKRGQRPPTGPTLIPEGEQAPFEPAAPKLSRIARDSTAAEQEMTSGRPVLSAADRGQWEYVEYVSTGDGPLLFKTDHMMRYGLASAVVQNDEELKQFFGARNLIRLNQTWSEGLVAWLTFLPIQGLLVVIFLIAFFIEITHPGAMVPASIAFLALAALLAPPILLNMAAWWVLGAIALGIALIALEIFVFPGFGLPGIAGLLLLFGGLLGALVPSSAFFPDAAHQQNELMYGFATLFLAIATAGTGMYFLARNFASLPLLNRLVLRDAVVEGDGDELLAAMAPTSGPIRIGMKAIAITPLRPSGRVEIAPDEKGAGQFIDAVSENGYIEAGTRVRIVSVSPFRIGVEPEGPQA